MKDDGAFGSEVGPSVEVDREVRRAPGGVTAVPTYALAVGAFLVLLVGGALATLTESAAVPSEVVSVVDRPETEEMAIGETRLLHPLGGPVDTVERFIVGFNYGQSEIDVAMFGCSHNEATVGTANVECSMVFDSNSVKHPELDRTIRPVIFAVNDGRIADVSIGESRPASPVDATIEALLSEWISGYYGPIS